ncbi:MAG: helix-turn-helix domain-containing protein [Christensenellales bacterium]
MKKIDLKYICTTIGNLSGIPIRLLSNKRQVLYHSLVDLPKDPFELYKNDILNIKDNVGYFVTPFFNYYGVLNHQKNTIVIGPTRQIPAMDKDLKEIAFMLGVPQDSVDDFLSAMKSIVTMPLESIMQTLCMVNYVLNGEKISLGEITIYDNTQENIIKDLEQQRIEQIDNDQQLLMQQDVHNTLALEQTIMNIVRKGDTNALKDWIANAPAVRSGILANNHLRHLKNTFIVTVTLVTRSAIRGGMDVEVALSLSDAYIQRCELLSSMADITNLQYRMVVDYTERVERIRQGRTPSQLAIDVANYVQKHLSESITTDDIAKHLFLSRSRLSTKFKQETGTNLCDFILQEKIEEAKRLLRYSDKSLLSISSYLGFSSQSHFSNVFKKLTTYSPGEYREQHNR